MESGVVQHVDRVSYLQASDLRNGNQRRSGRVANRHHLAGRDGRVRPRILADDRVRWLAALRISDRVDGIAARCCLRLSVCDLHADETWQAWALADDEPYW